MTAAAGASINNAAAIKIEELEGTIEGLESANKVLTEGVEISAEEADNKIEGFETRIGELEAEVVDLNKALKDAKAKGGK